MYLNHLKFKLKKKITALFCATLDTQILMPIAVSVFVKFKSKDRYFWCVC